MKKKIRFILIVIIVLGIIYLVLDYMQLIPQKYYDSKYFNIEIIKSDIDYNNNGIDDYTDILNGAKAEAKRHPKYKSAYYNDGYPPESEGVCTDVIWRSLKEAGYDFKSLIDKDIKENLQAYTNISKPDPNIDFRRVKNVKTYLERNTLILTNDINKISEFQAGDIVVFGSSHIAVISDKRNKKGIPYLIHNAGQINFEENTFERWTKNKQLTGHYRFKIKIAENS